MSRLFAILALMAAVAGLGLLNGHLLFTAVEIGALTAPHAGAAAAPSAMPAKPLSFRLDATTPQDFPETAFRPLFWESRRPQPAIPPAAVGQPGPEAAAEAATVDFRLAGILHDGGSKPRALIVWPQQPTGRWTEEGAEIDGWRVTRIGRHAIRIEAGSRQIELKLP